MSEEAYKVAIANEIFSGLRYIPARIDFVIADGSTHLFWAETKNKKTDIYAMLTQLLLTVRKIYQSGEITPPSLIGCFDPETFAIFNFADFIALYNQGVVDWSITPSNYNNPEFKKFREIVKATAKPPITFDIKNTDGIQQLKDYIKKVVGHDGEQVTLFDAAGGLEITLTNLQHIFNIWTDEIKPRIGADDNTWKALAQDGVYPSDFFLADVYGDAESGNTVDPSMKVIYKSGEYKCRQAISSLWEMSFGFKDGGVAHGNFWRKYKRPPRSEKHAGEKITPYNEILERKDLLVPRDIMERKGAFFTPQIWVHKAHEAIAEALGEDWQKKYYVWDCACGTGNLLTGLTNRKNLFASTIDESDIRIIHANMKGVIFKENAFQFDFLNDSFDKLPEKLRKIVESPEERKKLIVFINPPYAEATTLAQAKGIGKSKDGVTKSEIKKKYENQLGKARMEVFAQFLIRIYYEVENCYIAEFSKLKLLQTSNFNIARKHFQARLLSCFLAPADSFDNVKGKFPIGFKIWDTKVKEAFKSIEANVYDKKAKYLGTKIINCHDDKKLINEWIAQFRNKNNFAFGLICYRGTDFQNQSFISLEMPDFPKGHATTTTTTNLSECCIYLAVRHAIDANWLNDRDQFLYPNAEEFDTDFINDCLVFTLFSGQNHISREHGDNHWIPFTEDECGSDREFEHDTVREYLNARNIPEALTSEARAVYDAGLEIFRYYHEQKGWSVDGQREYNHNAALYDIRAFFQGRKPDGKMNVKSVDEKYQGLIENLRKNIKILRDNNIAPKVYEYGFLLE